MTASQTVNQHIEVSDMLNDGVYGHKGGGQIPEITRFAAEIRYSYNQLALSALNQIKDSIEQAKSSSLAQTGLPWLLAPAHRESL